MNVAFINLFFKFVFPDATSNFGLFIWFTSFKVSSGWLYEARVYIQSDLITTFYTHLHS